MHRGDKHEGAQKISGEQWEHWDTLGTLETPHGLKDKYISTRRMALGRLILTTEERHQLNPRAPPPPLRGDPG